MIMEQDEITRRNVAIEAFNGTDKRKQGWYIDENGSECWSYYPARDFREDWKLLMPVVEKITKESNLGFHFFPPFGREVFTCRLGTNKNSEGKSMIEATWMAVSEYVLSLGK